MSIDNTRIVAFPEAGEGVCLFFRNRDMLALRTEYGADYMVEVESAILKYDMKVIESALKVGGKKNDKPHSINIDDVDGIVMEKLQERLLDAFTLSATGRTFLEHDRWIRDQVAKRQAEGAGDLPPATSPADSSAVSSETPSGSESGKPNSGK